MAENTNLKNMTFDEFREEYTKRLSEAFDIPLDDFEFLPDGLTAEADDKELLEKIRETNMRYSSIDSDTLEGNFLIMNWTDADKTESGRTGMCRIELDSPYVNVKENGWDAEIDKIRTSVRTMFYPQSDDVMSNINDYEATKEHLILRAINYDGAKQLLNQCIYKKYGDIAVVLYLELSTVGGSYQTTKVTRGMLKMWGKDPIADFKELWDIAMTNTMIKMPPRIYPLSAMFSGYENVTYSEGRFLCAADQMTAPKNPKDLNVLTTTKKLNGAIAAFYPGVCEKLASLIGGSFYISFTSLHEAILHRINEVTPAQIRSNLIATNVKFGRGDMLSVRAFLYNAKKRRLEAK